MKCEGHWMKAANRFEMICKIEKGMFKMDEGAAILGISVRQLRRLRRKSEAYGLKSLVHQGLGRSVWNQMKEAEREAIIKVRKAKNYRDYNILHFQQKLRDEHKIKRSHECLRQLLLKENLYTQKPRRRKKRHRKRFEAPKAGVLVQRDTSIHLWVPHTKRWWRLIVDLDDHSRKITGALFSEHDDVLSNMLVSWETISTHGLPFAYYTDNNPIYNPKNKKPRDGMYRLYRLRRGEQEDDTVSQWKRAINELGVECIHSTPYQPQGKGKVERIFKFMQDRLVNELATANVKTISEANKILRRWAQWYNHHHVHSTTGMIPNERYLLNNIFRPLPGDIRLENIFCLRYERKVKADNTIKFEGKVYQIKKNEYRISYAKAKVEVRVTLSSKLKIFYKKREIGCYPYKPKDTMRLPSGEDILALV